MPAVVYDVGGLGEPVRAFGAGRVVPPATSTRSRRRSRELLDDAEALAAARAGAGARATSSPGTPPPRAHLALYRELV